MPKAYWISATVRFTTPTRSPPTRSSRAPRSRRAGGKFLARGSPAKVYEKRDRAAHGDPAVRQPRAGDRRARQPGYQEALRVLGKAVDRDLRIIEGVD